MDFNSQKNPSNSSSSLSKLVLYSFWQSSCSWRVRFGLNVKGLSYEYKSVNLVQGEQFSPEFEQVNPLHLVPVLVDGDLVVSDSYAILLYLEEKYPEKALLPLDPQLKAVNLQAASIVTSSIQPLHMLSVLKYIEEKVGPEERLSWALYNIEKGFLALEKLLKDCAGTYATGEEVYMADVFLAPQIAVAIARFNIDMSKFPTLSRMYESYKALPEFQASLPERQPDAGQRMVEDEALCRCWLAISQDPEAGIHQPMSVFWERVRTLFLSQPGVQANRNTIFISHRWSLIQKVVNKFCGYLKQVQWRSQSGIVDANMVNEAKRMYFTLHRKHSIYDTCWEILCHSYKWDEVRTQPQKSTSQTSLSSIPSTPPNTLIFLDSDIDLEQQCFSNRGKRSIGQTAAKEARSKIAVHDVRFEAMVVTQCKIVKVLTDMSSKSFEKEQERAVNRQRSAENREAQLQMLAEMNAREQRKEDHLIMSMNMFDLTPMQISYFENRQR